MMKLTVLESFQQILKNSPPKTPQEDKALWEKFLKDRYGIPYTEDTEDNAEGQEEKLCRRGPLGSNSRADRQASST